MPHHLRKILYSMSWKVAATQRTKTQIDNVDNLIRLIRYNPYVMEDYFSWELALLLDSVPSSVLVQALTSGEHLTPGISTAVWDNLRADNSMRAHAGRTKLSQIVESSKYEQLLGSGTLYSKYKNVKDGRVKDALWDSGDPDLVLFTDYATSKPGDKRSLILFENKTKASLQPYQLIYYLNQLFWANSVTKFFDFSAMVFVFNRDFDSALRAVHLPTLFREDRAAWLEQIKQSDKDSQAKIDAIRISLKDAGLWDKFKDFCAALPVVVFQWEELLNKLVEALQPACQEAASRVFAQKIVANIQDFMNTLRPNSQYELSYERYVELEDMIDLNDILKTGRGGGALSKMFMGLNETVKGVIGSDGVKLIEHIEETPIFRLIPEQLNKNFALPESERTYCLFAEGISLARLKASDKRPSGWEVYVQEGADVFGRLGIEGWATSALGNALRALDPAGDGRYFDAGAHFVPVVRLLWERVCEHALQV